MVGEPSFPPSTFFLFGKFDGVANFTFYNVTRPRGQTCIKPQTLVLTIVQMVSDALTFPGQG